MKDEAQLHTIIAEGFCIGCGACAHATRGGLGMRMNRHRMLQADLDAVADLEPEQLDAALRVCPFSDRGPNEDELAGDRYSSGCRFDSRVGYFRGLRAGHVADGAFREKGSSGGVVSWILAEVLKRNLADRVIHVKEAGNSGKGGRLFAYAISESLEEIQAGAKSRYYPIEASEMLDLVCREEARYVFVGIPCFIKAVRRAQRVSPLLDERIVLTVGLVCGHLKSAAFAECFGWQSGIAPGDLEKIDFRVKFPDRPAGDYGVSLKAGEVDAVVPTRSLFGSNWGLNFFRYPACNYCDDVFAETADVAIGDAWIPDYDSDGRGNSVVVVRDERVSELISEGMQSGVLAFDEISEERMAASQAGGLRDRREGLACRLALKRRRGDWVPPKRFGMDAGRPPLFREVLFGLREASGNASHHYWRRAVERNDYGYFARKMRLFAKAVRWCYHPLYKYVALVLWKLALLRAPK